MFSPSTRQITIAVWLAIVASLAIILPVEIRILQHVASSPIPLATWFADFNADTTPYLLVLAALPIAWLRRGGPVEGETGKPSPTRSSLFHQPGFLAIFFGFLSFAMSVWWGWEISSLPPGYHDEYSYLFQVKTFLAGRLNNPGLGEANELLHSMHILSLTDGPYASRYFPGVATWLMPFVAIGQPYLANWVATGAMTSLGVLIAFELSGLVAAVTTGLLFTLSPSLLLFGNTMLSHQPTSVGLLIFIYACLRGTKTSSNWLMVVSGAGLAFSMLCRPLTAFAICLPFAVAHLYWLLKGTSGRKIAGTALFVVPIIAGLGLMAVYDRAITGSFSMTPYTLYNQNYTPRHVFGFNNVERGETWIADASSRGESLPIDVEYDTWAENLDLSLAFRTEWKRIIASYKWTWGIVPLNAALILFVVLNWKNPTPAWLLFASTVMLHLFHFFYWFVGIFEYHYVYEAGPLDLILMGFTTAQLFQLSESYRRPALRSWWGVILAVGAMTSLTSLDPLWTSWLSQGISQMEFARRQHEELNVILDDQTQKPAVVIIRQKPDDLHLDYIVNSPSLDSPIIRVRYLPEKFLPEKVSELFPDRSIYLFDLVDQKITPIASPRQ